MSSQDETRDAQTRHWGNVLSRNVGDLVAAVGSESIEHKLSRYRSVSEVFRDDPSAEILILDVGCGIADLYPFLRDSFPHRNFEYVGIDLLPDFCEVAQDRYPEVRIECTDIEGVASQVAPDYVILSGLFHQPGEVDHSKWEAFMLSTVSTAFKIARKGIAFNFLSSEAEFQKEGNFYADELEVLKFVSANLSRYQRLDKSSPLFEATVCVFKAEYIRETNAPELHRYIG